MTTIAPAITTHEPMLDIPEVASILKVAPATIQKWLATKREPRPVSYRIGGAVRFRRADIDAFIAASLHAD